MSYSLVSGASGVPGVVTYTIPSNAGGWYYKVTVTATNADGSTPADSAALGAVSGPVIVPPAQGLNDHATHITGSDGGQVTIAYADAHTEAEIASALAAVNGYTYTVHKNSTGHYAVNEQTAGSSAPPASWWLDSTGPNRCRTSGASGRSCPTSASPNRAARSRSTRPATTRSPRRSVPQPTPATRPLPDTTGRIPAELDRRLRPSLVHDTRRVQPREQLDDPDRPPVGRRHDHRHLHRLVASSSTSSRPPTRSTTRR